MLYTPPRYVRAPCSDRMVEVLRYVRCAVLKRVDTYTYYNVSYRVLCRVAVRVLYASMGVCIRGILSALACGSYKFPEPAHKIHGLRSVSPNHT